MLVLVWLISIFVGMVVIWFVLFVWYVFVGGVVVVFDEVLVLGGGE